MGLCNYYRRFIRNFATVASPLTRLTHKDVAFSWDDAQQTAFAQLKQQLTAAPVLVVYDRLRATRIHCDASATCVGAVLEQLCDDSQWHPVEFYSKRLNNAQCNYSATERKMLAVVLSLDRWR